MKKIFKCLTLALCILLSAFSIQAQTYGGEIKAKDNAGVIGIVRQKNDGLKVNDSVSQALLSAINTKLPSGLTVTSTRLLVDGSGVTQPVSGTVTINAIPAGTNNIGDVDVLTLPSIPAGTNNIGDVDVLTVPADPFGANADAASATGSISAKLRFIAATGIPVTSLPSVTIGTFPDNEPFNIAQINGQTPLMGAGNTGTGSLRVTIATDQATVPVSLASVPTHAVTIAAGASAIGKAEDDLSANLDVGAAMLAVRKATPANTSGTDGDYEFLQINAGRLWTSATIDAALPAGTNAIGKLAANTGVTIGAVELAASQTLSTVSTVTSLTQFNGNAIALNTGTRSAGTLRVTIATDDIVPASQSGTWTVQPGNTANTTAWLTSDRPATSGGYDVNHLVSAATTNATVVKASAGQLYGYYIFNANASARKIAFHNTASSPTAGSSVFFSIVIPAGSGANVAFPAGIPFSTGIAFTTVTGTADSDNTAVASGDLIINLFYK